MSLTSSRAWLKELFDIVHEDADLLVINKPAGLVCHPTKGDEYSSLISRARLHLGAACEPQLINRLDRETSGITFVAKNAETALEIRRIWERRDVVKTYLAVVHGAVASNEGLIDAPLGKDTRSPVAIKDCVVAGGSPAQTQFRVLRRFSRSEGEFSLLEVQPLTGRKHQIRIHLAHIGHAIVGDKLYGPDENIYLDFVSHRITDDQRRKLIVPYHALHAAEVRFEWRGEKRRFKAHPEEWFATFSDRT